MNTKKRFVVVAYDVANDKRRRKVVKTLFRYGASRVNYSVMEIIATDRDLKSLKTDMKRVISLKEDTVIFYPLDMNCFAQIQYLRNDSYNAPLTKVKAV